MTWRAQLKAHPLAFGTMAVGGQYATTTDADAIAAITWAAADGVRLFDTAPQYGCGLAEERLGAALQQMTRRDLLIATKVGKAIVPLGSGGQRQKDLIFPGGHDCEMMFDYSYDGTMRMFEASLKRLGTDRIDLVLMHDVTRHFHGEAGVHERFDEACAGAVRALQSLRDEGVIAAFGTGLKDTDIAARFVEEAGADVVLLPGCMSLLEASGMTSGLFDICLKHDVPVIAAAPFDSGILATGSAGAGTFGYRPASKDVVRRVAAIEAICQRFDVPLQAAALQYPRRHPAVATVLVGMRHVADVDENTAWARVPLPDELWRALEREAGVAAIDA